MTTQRIDAILAQIQTPAYVFDIACLRARIARLRGALPPGTGLCYAVKANAFIVGRIADLVERVEACSPGEVRICRAHGIADSQLVLSGVYKAESDLAAEVARKTPAARITVESPHQLECIRDLAERSQKKLCLLLRLSGRNQFGMDAQTLRAAARTLAGHPYLEIAGLQYYSGTQKTSLKRMARELSELDALMETMAREDGLPLRELEYGPGLPVRYFAGETLDEDALLAGLGALLGQLRTAQSVTLEIGRSIAASCGSYYTRVVDMKRSDDENYAIVDGGIHQLAYYGQALAMRRPECAAIPARTAGEECPWNICGALCTANDILVKRLPLRDLHIGDVLAFQNTGAYSATEGMALFLSRALPAVALAETDGSCTLARAPMATEDLNTERKN